MTGMYNFFYAGQVPISDEVNDDVLVGIVQSKRSMFYNRGYGAGVADYENTPMTFSTFVALRYEVAKWLATRNSVVTNGQNGYPDRRAVTSQDLVTVTQDSESSLTILVQYILMADLTRKQSVSVPIGGIK